MTVPRSKFSHTEAQLRSVLTRQRGLITTRQAEDLGLSPSALSKRLRAGSLERVLPGVYRSTVVRRTRAQEAHAAVLWAGPDAVASHASAAEIWGIGDAWRTQPEIWLPANRGKHSNVVRVHRGAVDAHDRRIRDGIPVTSAARTLIDFAPRLDCEGLEAAVEDLLHRGLTTISMIERRLSVLGGKGRPGSAVLKSVLDTRGCAPLESRLEVKAWNILRKLEPRPVRQFEVRVGAKRYRLDFAWPHLKVAVEADGYTSHRGRHTFVADRRRLADLVSAGWVVLPVTWEDCTSDPGALVRRVGALLIRAA